MISLKIRCIAANTISIYKYYISIYDKNAKLIKETETNSHGMAIIKVIPELIYKIAIKCNQVNPNYLCQKVYLYQNETITFFFNQVIIKKHFITFEIEDPYYKGLIIEKGVINLCPNHTPLPLLKGQEKNQF